VFNRYIQNGGGAYNTSSATANTHGIRSAGHAGRGAGSRPDNSGARGGQPSRAPQHGHERPGPTYRASPQPSHSQRPDTQKPLPFIGGLNGMLGGITDNINSMISRFLPGADVGDIFLLLMLFFLYNESGDEEFLIILVVLAFNIFRG
jgi:hypothetical protein